MPNIRPSSDLRNKYNEISTYCHRYGEPVYITKNGYGDMVIMSMKAYEEKMFMADVYSKLAEAESDVKEGKVSDAREDLKTLREKYGL